MAKKRIEIAAAVFALPLVVCSAALANSTHDRGKTADFSTDDRFVPFMQTLNERDFCTARQFSRPVGVANRESRGCMRARRAASIYRQARRAEVGWYKQHC